MTNQSITWATNIARELNRIDVEELWNLRRLNTNSVIKARVLRMQFAPNVQTCLHCSLPYEVYILILGTLIVLGEVSTAWPILLPKHGLAHLIVTCKSRDIVF